ncbi:MAG: cell division ATPase MinD [Candidatus Woesearchaeota archaeon]|nr:cell division ATPase MinD [Candidatus Woesearchaeota archaeon]
MKTRFILVASGKGGVGKTTASLNIACALAQFGRDVVVVDANMSTPHIGIMLGSPLLENTLNKALRGSRSVRDCAYVHPSGIRIVPSSIALGEYAPEHTKQLRSVLAELAGTAEFVLIDASAGLGPEFRDAVRASDEILVVTSPDLPAVSDALKLIAGAGEQGMPILGVVVNRVGLSETLTLDNIRDLISEPIIGWVPEDRAVRSSLLIKQPVVFSHPDTAAAVGFKKVAATLLGQVYQPEVRTMHKPGMIDKIIEGINRIGAKK